MNTPHDYMSYALQLAERGRFSVSPNPMVGCVIVKDQHIVGEGYHQCAGEAHAEVFALQQAGSQAAGSTLYVTLEPCCFYGRTPACTTLLLSSGVKKIYVATIDPNPQVAGKGIELLRANGIEVEVGLCEAAAKQQNEIFFHYMTYQRPFVIAKWAMSLDGKMVTAATDNKQISGAEAKQLTYQLRQQVDAILVGANTVREDDPELTVRLADTIRQPQRIILLGQRPLTSTCKMLQAVLPGKTWVAMTEKAYHTHSSHFFKKVETLVLPEDPQGHISLSALLTELGKRSMTSLLVEGGRITLEKFLTEKWINKFHVYLAPVIIGSLAQKQPVTLAECTPLGKDFHFMMRAE